MPATQFLGHREIHVWLLWHETVQASSEVLRTQLSSDEQKRADRFLNERARFEFCLTRSALRHLLANYGIAAPLEMEFTYGEHGKPFLAKRDSSIQFNVAHTRELSAFAITQLPDIGIDVEFQRDVNDAANIVSSKFAAEEQAVFASTASDEQKQTFFRGWTRKEAFIKATGEGLCRPLSSFAVTIDSDNAQFLRIDDDKLQNWKLINLQVGEQHAGAVAARSENAEAIVREWRHDMT